MTSKKYLKLIFLLIKKLIAKYQRTESILMYKYKYGKYLTGSFSVGSNIYLNLITCDNKIFILGII